MRPDKIGSLLRLRALTERDLMIGADLKIGSLLTILLLTVTAVCKTALVTEPAEVVMLEGLSATKESATV